SGPDDAHRGRRSDDSSCADRPGAQRRPDGRSEVANRHPAARRPEAAAGDGDAQGPRPEGHDLDHRLVASGRDSPGAEPGQDEASATASLQQAGFTVNSVDSATTDQTQNGVVLTEQPTAGTRAASGATVTITVGRYSAED